MVVNNSANTPQLPPTKIISVAFDPTRTEESAKDLVQLLYPDWARADIEFVRFTDGITNTLLKCSNKTHPNPNSSAILLRAYGSKTDVLIDRERECSSHQLLASHHLAPPLLARFPNGLFYQFVPGTVCSVAQMASKEVSDAVARRLGEWHGVLPVPAGSEDDKGGLDANTLWGVFRRWAAALPEETVAKKDVKERLVREVEWVIAEMRKARVVGEPFVLGHCDLLSGNVIILPKDPEVPESKQRVEVHFIDYEYATPCPRAFDLANHFAEWTGFACDYKLLPSRSTRRNFITSYLHSYHKHKHSTLPTSEKLKLETEALEKEVDLYRGLPGFYWGIWALIQAEISSIEFDYKEYAELRLGEYWDWKEAYLSGEGGGLREKVWARE